MFIEPRTKPGKKGWIEVICGPMFSGKTEELIRRLRRAQIANLKVEIFKPMVDNRYDEDAIVSHNENAIPSTPISNSQSMLLLGDGMEVIGVDEAQFFDDELPGVCDKLALKGIRVIVAGLDMDYQGRPFGQIPNLLSIAEYITKLHAICMRCGDTATHSFRKSTDEETILIGEKDLYEPRCRFCYYLQDPTSAK